MEGGKQFILTCQPNSSTSSYYHSSELICRLIISLCTLHKMEGGKQFILTCQPNSSTSLSKINIHIPSHTTLLTLCLVVILQPGTPLALDVTRERKQLALYPTLLCSSEHRHQKGFDLKTPLALMVGGLCIWNDDPPPHCLSIKEPPSLVSWYVLQGAW